MDSNAVVTGNVKLGLWDCEWQLAMGEDKASYTFPVLMRNNSSGGIEYKVVSIEGKGFEKLKSAKKENVHKMLNKYRKGV